MLRVVSVTVSAVIPTRGRPELSRALASARAQQFRGTLEVVVAYDGTKADCSPATRAVLDDLADRVLYTDGRGAPAARNLGAEHAVGEYIAYLDDDDEWFWSKFRTQLDMFAADPELTVASSRVVHRIASTEISGGPVPGRLIDRGTRVEDYLFRRRKPSPRRASIFTSTLMVRSAAVHKAGGWDVSLRRHHDWDFLMRLQASGGLRIRHAPEVLSVIYTGSTNSISASNDWSAAVSWADNWRSAWDSATYVDFLAGQALRYAIDARSREGIRTCLTRMREARRLPAAGPSVLGLGGLVPRAVVSKLLVR